MGDGGTGEIEAVSTHIYEDTVYFGIGGSNGGENLGVVYFALMGDC